MKFVSTRGEERTVLKVALGNGRKPTCVLMWSVESCEKKHERGLEEAVNSC